MRISNQDLPKVTVTILPSMFKPYPKDVVIRYVPYSFGDLKNIGQTANLIDKYNLVLEGIICEGMSNLDLTLPDLLFLMLLRRLSSLEDSGFKITSKCLKCEAKLNKTIMLSDIEFEDIKAKSLPILWKDYKIMPLTIGQYIKNPDLEYLQYFSMQYKKQQSDSAKQEDIYSDILNMYSPEDEEDLNRIDELLYHSVKPIVIECPSCKTKNSTIFSTYKEGDIFMPFRRSKGISEDRIHFSL